MPAFRLTEVGFDKTESIFLRTTMEMASEYDLAEWLWVDDRNADVILVNTDCKECTTKFNLDKPGQSKIRPILICCSSSGEKCNSYTHTLVKPITYSMLTTLLQMIEPDLAKTIDNSSYHPQNSDKQSSASNQDGAVLRINKDATASLENQDHSDLQLHIDDDSDYDIYDLLMDSEFDSIQADTAITTDSKPQRAANDQSETITSSQRMKTKRKRGLPFKRHLEKEKFMGLIKKHVLSKFKHTG
ncbi:MAG: hypothetical protein JAZ19_16330 [Candidatus Thiodiazotropha taylori]|nr:hypothetical protein [Candidatus Thiodiazotropha taylori]